MTQEAVQRITGSAQAADLRKDLTKRLAATFAYADINFTDTLFSVGHTQDAQLAGHSTLITCGTLQPFRDIIANKGVTG